MRGLSSVMTLGVIEQSAKECCLFPWRGLSARVPGFRFPLLVRVHNVVHRVVQH